MRKQKKIGIMSMQRIVNYGSFLQAYALKKTLENLDCKVNFVDYKVEKPLLTNGKDWITYSISIFKKVIMEIFLKCKFLWFVLPKGTREVLKDTIYYRNEILPILGVTNRKKYTTDSDTLIIGSDEVFNCLQKNINVGFSRNLFGVNTCFSNVYTYAASFGNTTLERIINSGVENQISNYLKKIEDLSVRDANSYDIINKLTGVEPRINLDPVLIYDFSNELVELNFNTDYIVVYAYRNRINENEKAIIKNFAKKNKCELVSIGGYQDFCDRRFSGSPFEVLTYIKNSKYVITDTFHGTIYSIIFNKNFVSLIRRSENNKYGNEEKLMYLLKSLKLKERAVYNAGNLSELLLQEIDFSIPNSLIKEEKINTINYLKKII